MINFLNLEYFLVAADELNFTKAAKKLYISQQSLSNHISNLEKEFQVLLFNRTNPLTLTYAGKALQKRARQLIYLRDETYRELADIKDFTVGELSIGMSYTRERYILPDVLPVYKERFPHIELNLIEGNSEELARDLVNGDIDLLIDLLPISAEQVETIPIYEEEILLFVPEAVLERSVPDKAETIREQLSIHTDLGLLADCPFILLREGNRLRTIADEMFEEAQMTPNIVLETDNIETVLDLCMRGMGIIFYPRMLIPNREEYFEKGLERIGMNCYSLDNPHAHSTLAIAFHKGRYMARATREFINLVKEKTLKKDEPLKKGARPDLKG